MMHRKQERGEGRLGLLIALIVVGVGIFLAVKIVPIRVTAYEFKDTIRQECRRAAIHGDTKKLADMLLEKAEDLEIPLRAQNLKVRKTRSEMIVSASYEQPVDLKLYQYVYRFNMEERSPLF